MLLFSKPHLASLHEKAPSWGFILQRSKQNRKALQNAFFQGSYWNVCKPAAQPDQFPLNEKLKNADGVPISLSTRSVYCINTFILLLLFFMSRLKCTTATFPSQSPEIVVRHPGQTETETIVALVRNVLSVAHLLKVALEGEIVSSPNASTHRAHSCLHKSKRINRAGERVIPPPLH